MKYNNIKKIILSGVMCVILMISLGITAFAVAPSEITFGNNFTFNPGTSDLFSNFKGLLPGESRTQEIKISNKSSESAKFYLRIAASEQDKTLTKEQQDLVWDLIYNKIKVKVKDLNGKIIYDGSIGGDKNSSKTPDEVTEGTFFMGEISANTDKAIKVELIMDESVGNEYQGLSGSVKWIFIAEQNGNTETIEINDGRIPLANLPGSINGNGTGAGIIGAIVNTGDTSKIIMWSTLLVSVGIAFAIVSVVKKKKSQEAN